MRLPMGSGKRFIWTTFRPSLNTAWIERGDFAKICQGMDRKYCRYYGLCKGVGWTEEKGNGYLFFIAKRKEIPYLRG